MHEFEPIKTYELKGFELEFGTEIRRLLHYGFYFTSLLGLLRLK